MRRIDQLHALPLCYTTMYTVFCLHGPRSHSRPRPLRREGLLPTMWGLWNPPPADTQIHLGYGALHVASDKCCKSSCGENNSSVLQLPRSDERILFYLESCTADFFFVCRDSSHLVLGVLVALQASKSVRVEATCSQQHGISEKWPIKKTLWIRCTGSLVFRDSF